MNKQIARLVAGLLVLANCAFIARSEAGGQRLGGAPPLPCRDQISYRGVGQYHASNDLKLIAPNRPPGRVAQGPNPIDDARFFVRQLYRDFFRRETPDPGAVEYWAAPIIQCGTDWPCINQKRIDVSRVFIQHPDFVNMQFPINPDLKSPQGLDPYNRAFVRQCYLTFLHREPEQGGFDNWMATLISYGSPTPTAGYNHVIHGFINSIEYRARFVSPPC